MTNDDWIAKLRLEASNWTNITQDIFDELAKKSDRKLIVFWLKDDPFVNIMFGTAYLYGQCKEIQNMWIGLQKYCGYGSSPFDDTYYTEILAELIDEEMPYEKDEPYKNSPDYHILINGTPVPLKLPQRQ